MLTRNSFLPYQWLLLIILLVASSVAALHNGIDFVVYYYAAQVSLFDVSQVYQSASPSGGYYYYAPTFLALIKPLGYLPYGVAKWLFTTALVISACLFFSLMLRFFPHLKTRPLFWVWAYLFTINPFHTGFQAMNIQLPLVAALLFAETLRETESARNHFWAGVLTSLCAVIKVYPGFIACFYFLVGSRKLREGIVVGFVLSLLLPLVFWGPTEGIALWKGFFQNLVAYSSHHQTEDISFMLCWPTLVKRTATLLGIGKGPTELFLKVSELLMAAAFLLYAGLSKRIKRDPILFRATLFFAYGLMVFLNPSSLIHYFIFYCPFFFFELDRMAVRQNRIVIGVLAVATLFMAGTTDFILGPRLNTALENASLPTLGAMLLLSLYLLKGKLKSPA